MSSTEEVEKDEESRFEALRKSAEAGDASSQYELAYLLRDQRVKLRSEQEEVGREKRRMAVALLQLSAAQGYVAAAVDLARWYLTAWLVGHLNPARFKPSIILSTRRRFHPALCDTNVDSDSIRMKRLSLFVCQYKLFEAWLISP